MITSKMEKLPIRPKIHHDESLSGYLFKLSKANHFTTISTHAAYLNLTTSQTINNEFSEESSIRLFKWVGLECEWFSKSNLRLKSHCGDSLYKKIVLKNKVKFCPLCIQDSYYHRAEWCWLPIQMCSIHFVLLQEECPQCGTIITMRDFSDQVCGHCQFLYLRTSHSVVDNILYSESQFTLQRMLMENEYSPFKSLQIHQYLQLAFTSFLFLDGVTDHTKLSDDTLNIFINSNKKHMPQSKLRLSIAFADVHWMYHNFPDHFYSILNEFLRRNITGMKRYGALQKLEEVLDNPSFKEIQDIYHTFLLTKLDEGLVRKDLSIFKKKPRLLENRQCIRREEVKETTRITYEKMHRLSTNIPSLLGIVCENRNNKYIVDKVSLEKCLEEESKWITKKETGLILGINVTSIQALIDNGYLTADNINSGRYKRLLLSDVHEVMERCRGLVVQEMTQSSLSLHDALIKYSVNNLTISSVIKSTISGQLKPITSRDDGTLADNYYDVEELIQCLAQVNKDQQQKRGYYFNDLLKILKIGEKRLWKLINENVIQPDFTLHMKDGRKRYFFKEGIVSVLTQLIEDENKIKCRIQK